MKILLIWCQRHGRLSGQGGTGAASRGDQHWPQRRRLPGGYSDSASIRNLFEQTGKFDALVCAAGSVNFVALGEMSEADFELGLRDKLMGQVNLLLIGREYANDGASFTFTRAFSTATRSAPAPLPHWSTAHWMPSSRRRQSNCHAACASTR